MWWAVVSECRRAGGGDRGACVRRTAIVEGLSELDAALERAAERPLFDLCPAGPDGHAARGLGQLVREHLPDNRQHEDRTLAVLRAAAERRGEGGASGLAHKRQRVSREAVVESAGGGCEGRRAARRGGQRVPSSALMREVLGPGRLGWRERVADGGAAAVVSGGGALVTPCLPRAHPSVCDLSLPTTHKTRTWPCAIGRSTLRWHMLPMRAISWTRSRWAVSFLICASLSTLTATCFPLSVVADTIQNSPLPRNLVPHVGGWWSQGLHAKCCGGQREAEPARRWLRWCRHVCGELGGPRHSSWAARPERPSRLALFPPNPRTPPFLPGRLALPLWLT